ncbi:MAG TPA: nitroreductase [Clostridiales bacterium]|nr:nitroreductase [Clostridiales bacterium]
MKFNELSKIRQSCRNYDPDREVEQEKIDAILETACIAPSACNGQPYHITVCQGETAKKVAVACQSFGMNKFLDNAKILIVISEGKMVTISKIGSKASQIDYRSIDIGILSAYITSEAADQGLGSCIIGWLNDKKIREVIDLDKPVRLVIALGYANPNDVLRNKKRKDLNDLVRFRG